MNFAQIWCLALVVFWIGVVVGESSGVRAMHVAVVTTLITMGCLMVAGLIAVSQ